ncbi:MAG: hypothetical protein K1X92_15740 [Bacteroidia bacterium]|nr:hypothetical protein [Bacteroidia bacterium]
MLKLVCGFMFIVLLSTDFLVAQLPDIRFYSYQYELNNAIPILYNVCIRKKHSDYQFMNTLSKTQIDSLCNAFQIPNEDWLTGFGFTNRRRECLIRGECNANTFEWLDSLSLISEKSLYRDRGYGNTGDLGDLFRFSYDSVSNKFENKSYAYNILNYNNLSCMSLDSVTYEWGKEMPLFHYGVKNKEGIQYLTVGFCPQIGIIYFHYPKNNVKIELKYINNLVLKCYITNNICLTPFCNIR